MAFGIYIHIPYCLQICPYCDFTKYELGKTLPPEKYVELLIREIQLKGPDVPHRGPVDTIYFGGGTPSLLSPSLILSVIDALAKAGFDRADDAETTIEIDPATIDEPQLFEYLAMGVNRFSVGAQTFNERLLKIAGRKHTAQDTVELLELLKRHGVNYSFDLLFALPTQSLAELRADVATALSFNPSHISAYCLNVPDGHKMSIDRAPEDDQIEMFNLIEESLANAGIFRYEVSNFAKPGLESRHNLLYWTDQPYWGLGLSSHSYFPKDHKLNLDSSNGSRFPWGTRFWNVRAMKRYADDLEATKEKHEWDFIRDLPEDQVERLQEHQALTDFCHTSLRLSTGLIENALRLKFGPAATAVVLSRLLNLESSGHIESTSTGWKMTSAGRLVANLVFEKLTFLPDELNNAQNSGTTK